MIILKVKTKFFGLFIRYKNKLSLQMKTIQEIIQRNVNRSEEILQKLGGYKKYLEFMKDKSNDNSHLKKELLFMNEEMASVGVMTIEEFGDPSKREKFFGEHYPNVTLGFCNDDDNNEGTKREI